MQKSATETYSDSVTFSDYKLKTGDYLYVRVYSADEMLPQILNGTPGATSQNQGGMFNVGDSPYSDLITYLIDAEGNIEFPMIGKINLEGKTLRESGRIFEQKLSTMLKSCSVDVLIVRRYFSVIGEGASGRYAIEKEKMTIYEALAQIGDLGTYSDRSKIQLIREKNGKTEIKQFDLRGVDIINSEFYYIEPNDVIYVPTLKEQFFSVTSLPVVFSTIL
ncbi:MAG: polysaccharide biosynthesis/export family protein, partial [Paludibacter sp.]|nr:polysaccharide biosynthesis/export family protein [Paludibacter sp.]